MCRRRKKEKPALHCFQIHFHFKPFSSLPAHIFTIANEVVVQYVSVFGETDELNGTRIRLANVRRTIPRHGGHTWDQGEPDHGVALYLAQLRMLKGVGNEKL